MFAPETFGSLMFIGMVFCAVLVLALGISIPTFGEQGRVRRRLKNQLHDIGQRQEQSQINQLLREKYLKTLSPLERQLESLPAMQRLSAMIEQAGFQTPAYRVVLLSVLISVSAGVLVWLLMSSWLFGLIAALVVLPLPYLRLSIARTKRLDRFDEQLPEAIDIIRRALQAGHPFSESLQLVAEGLEGPVAEEFGLTFADINYGSDMRRAMLGLLERVPSVTLMAFVTSVLVQKESGGNLAEILEKIAAVIRGRFRFQRKVKTLSAEGRLSAWILVMVPFVLFVIIYITTPKYLGILVESPDGRQLIVISFVLMVLGVFWIRKLLKIEV